MSLEGPDATASGETWPGGDQAERAPCSRLNTVPTPFDSVVVVMEVSKAIDEQILLEDETRVKLVETLKLIEEPWAKIILEGIRMDTEKHAVVLRSLKAALAQKPSESFRERVKLGIGHVVDVER